MQILLIDDDVQIQQTMMRLFKGSHYHIAPFSHPIEVLRNPKMFNPKVIVSDYSLPGMDGVTFLQKTLQIWPKASRILFSGFVDVKVAQRAIECASVVRLLTKPCGVFELRGAIEAAANMSQKPNHTTNSLSFG